MNGKIHNKSKRIAVLWGFTLLAVVLTVAYGHNLAQVSAAAGGRSYTNSATGDVFLGGDYIELGISQRGSFGTTDGQPKPDGFFGTAVRTNIGMSTNPAGFGVEPDLRMDFFLPGSPEERWAVGYKQGETTETGSNALLGGGNSVSDNVVVDQTSGETLKAQSTGTFNSTIKTTQVVSFGKSDRFFKNEVTLQNVSNSPVQSARYMRSFDPDNTVDKGGDYTTTNSIPYTHAAGDGKAVVMADTNWNDNDPVYQANGSRSPILFYSNDERARVSTFGFANSNPYADSAYDNALPKDTSIIDDQAITITFEAGTLAPGQSQTFVYYTSLDNRDIADVLQDIEKDVEANASNDKNGDGIIDEEQANVAVTTSSTTGKTVVLEVDEACTVEESLTKAASTHTVQDAGFTYPEGFLNFTADCGTPGYTTTVKLYYYDTNPDGLMARKYHPGTGAYFTVPNATIAQQEIYDQLTMVVSYQIVDGGVLDVDGAKNGIIIDPVGLGVQAVGAPNTGFGGAKR